MLNPSIGAVTVPAPGSATLAAISTYAPPTILARRSVVSGSPDRMLSGS